MSREERGRATLKRPHASIILTLPSDLAQKLVGDVKSGLALTQQERVRQIMSLFYFGESRPAAQPEAKTAKGGA